MNLKYISIIFSFVMLLNIFTSMSQIISAPDSISFESSSLADSPWPMFSCNAQRTGLSPYNTSATTGQLKWNFLTGGGVRSPVISSDGTIYVASWDEKLYAINPNGTEKWNFTIGGYMAISPAIGSDGTIYAGSPNKVLYAINPDGIEKWNFTTDGPVKYSPVIGSDGTIYVPSHLDSMVSILYAISPNGTEKWRYDVEGAYIGSPSISHNHTIYVGSTSNKLFAVNPNGTEKWVFLASDNIQNSPAIGPDGTIYAGSNDHNLYAINPEGTEMWRFTAGGPISWSSSPAIGPEGTIYVGSDDKNLYAINPNGTEKWKFLTNGLIQTAPAIGSEGTIYFGSDDFNIYALNPDGSKKWNFTTGFVVHSSPAINFDGTIYIGSFDNNLYAIGNPNIPPVANAGSDQTLNEGDTVPFNASASYDPDGTIESYEWDFDASNGLWWETGAPADAIGPTPTHIYGDDGIFVATLRVTDNDNLSATDICNITVLNVDPTIKIGSALLQVEIGLRVTGRKFNDVGMTLYENGTSIGYVSIERLPSSPNEQMVWIPMTLDITKTYSAVVTYIPEDPPDIGANPVWICIKSENGAENRIHHTFNVQQSKKRDSEHWNHVEPWEVDLNPHLRGLPFEINSHITDPGSDDETLTYTYGSQVVNVDYLNNPPIQDPFPSPEVNPRDIVDTIMLVYEGSGTIAVIAKDDDNLRLGIGEGSDSLDVL